MVSFVISALFEFCSCYWIFWEGWSTLILVVADFLFLVHILKKSITILSVIAWVLPAGSVGCMGAIVPGFLYPLFFIVSSLNEFHLVSKGPFYCPEGGEIGRGLRREINFSDEVTFRRWMPEEFLILLYSLPAITVPLTMIDIFLFCSHFTRVL